MRYYLNSNTDQVYSALTNNAVTSFSNTIEKLQHKTFGFMSQNFLFLTKGLVGEDMRRWKTDDVFFSVALEFDFTGTDVIPAYFVVAEDDGLALQPDIGNLADAPENTVAAFVCGEIPISFLTAILFENEENQIRFRKPSPDLWFPEKLYSIIDESIPVADARISAELVSELSATVDTFLTEEQIAEVASVINKRNRFKAMAYFALRETQNWQMDNMKSNVDFYILDLLDNYSGQDGLLYQKYAAFLAEKNSKDEAIVTIDEIAEKDTVLLSSMEYELDKTVLAEVIKWFMTFNQETITIDRECISVIANAVMTAAPEQNSQQLFDVIAEFLTSTYMNPEKALSKLNGHPVFKALMKFLDSSDNDAFMNRGCEDLNQYERRYAYIMFAALKGMRFVERDWKANTQLEHRLEEIVLSRFNHELLISVVAQSEMLPFCEKTDYVYGIEFSCAYWMGRQATLKVLVSPDAEARLQAVYDLVSKDKSIKLDKLECFECPVIITFTAGNYTHEVKAFNSDEIKKIVKDTKLITELSKNVQKKIDLAAFMQKYIMNEAWYSLVFDKYAIEIQRICRS